MIGKLALFTSGVVHGHIVGAVDGSGPVAAAAGLARQGLLLVRGLVAGDAIGVVFKDMVSGIDEAMKFLVPEL